MPRPKNEQPGYVMLKKAFEQGKKMSIKEAVAFTRLNRSTCRNYLHLLHGAKVICIAYWRQSNARGRWFPVYVFGDDEDVPKPNIEDRHARRRIRRNGITTKTLLWGKI